MLVANESNELAASYGHANIKNPLLFSDKKDGMLFYYAVNHAGTIN